jgi:phosphoglycolate phosphatase-like HAD superfamily hydrolase
MRLLLLFDIDGTLLLRASAEHRAALHDAIRAVWPAVEPDAYDVDAAGRTDLDIARDILVKAGVDARAVDDGLADLRAEATSAYARHCPHDLSDRVAPGIREALQALRERDDALLSLVTGNLEPIARLKLERAGLGAFFARGEGAFGSDHEDRAALPAIARYRAGRRHRLNGPWPRRDTVIVGDTPRDIACARADGVGVVAIATGPYGAAELTGADAVVASARDLVAALDAPRARA